MSLLRSHRINNITIMNRKQQQKTGKAVIKAMKSAMASPLKKAGLDSGSSKQAAAVIVNNAFGIKSAAQAADNKAFALSNPSATLQVNSGKVAAGHGVRGQVTVSGAPLGIQNKMSVRSMSSPNASIEINLPIVNKKNFSVHVGGSVKLERHRSPEYKVKGEAKFGF